MTQDHLSFARQFRFAAPYIRAHRGKTFVVGIPGEAVDHPNFQNLVHDLALLGCLGIRLVLVHGARSRIEQKLDDAGLQSHIHRDIRVTPEDQLNLICDAIHEVEQQIIKAFSRGMPNTPSFGMQNSVVSGNFLAARPVGVRDGVDYQYTGQVRMVHASRIDAALDSGAIVLVPTMGYSITGEIYNLSLEEVTANLVSSLRADKLISLCSKQRLNELHEVNETVFSILQLEHAVAEQADPDALVRAALHAVTHGLGRAHILDYETEGALLAELFTPTGSGLMIVERDVEKVRTATLDDVGGILEVIQPLESLGLLVKRDREYLEQRIDQFRVIDIDGMVIACAALFVYPEAETGELACLAIHPDFRSSGRGSKLVHHLEHWAQSQGLKQIVTLTTEGLHWFVEQGFDEASVEDLPAGRRELYDSKRASKVYRKALKSL